MECALLQILQISSTMGSIGTLMKGMAPRATPHLMAKNNLAYRASKSALNMGEHGRT